MKKLYTLLLISVLFSGAFKAQTFTLTQNSNEPSVGNIDYRKGQDSTTALPYNSGASQIWNFTSITSNSSAVIANTYTTPASIPSGTAFPAATIGQTNGANTSYFKSTLNKFEMIGLITSSLALTFTNTAIIANWPMSYGYSNTDPVGGTLVSSFGGGTFSGNIVTTVPGSGTLQLPGSLTFTNCLQVKSVLNILAAITVSMIPVTATISLTNYQYYAPTEKFPVLTIASTEIASALFNNTSTVIDINNNIYAGINEFILTNSINIFPNPAYNSLNVDITGEDSMGIEIYNELGQIVLSEKLFQHNNTVDISMLKSGIYFVRTTGDNKYSVRKLIKE